MTKVSIKAKPTFPATVAIGAPGGEPLKLPLIFKHRTKSQLKEFTDASKGRPELDLVLDMVDGWDAEEEFSREAVAELLEGYHTAGDDIAKAYVSELIGARRGN
jgi:hypothetical protein